MIIEKTSKKGLKNSEIVKVWANSVKVMRILMKENNLYLDELYLLSLIYRLTEDTGRPITKQEIIDNFNVLSFKRDKMLDNLFTKGYICNLREGPRKHGNGFRLSLTPLGEQLLIKYEKVMQRLCDGSK
jgi:predicted transcriptional regulator